MQAVRGGDVAVTWALLKARADVDARAGVAQLSCLHEAVTLDHAALVTLLLDHGADVHARDGSAATPLHIAARLGHNACAAALLAGRALLLSLLPSVYAVGS
jgi:ankyrin repeat protein